MRSCWKQFRDRSCGKNRLGGDEFVIVFPDCGSPLLVAEVVDEVLTRLSLRPRHHRPRRRAPQSRNELPPPHRHLPR
jgi:hypothetical protein